jgi:capsular exopolysaccharide synthesis family protein
MAITSSICLSAGAAYLYLATPLYTSSASLSVRPNAPRVMGGTEGEPRHDNDNFLNTERAVLTSTQLLAIATGRLDARQMRSFADVRNVVGYLKRELRAQVGKRDDIITIEFDSPYPREAAAVVNAVVDAYITYQSRQKRSTAAELLRVLEKDAAESEGIITAKSGERLRLRKSTSELSLAGSDAAPVEALHRLKDAAIGARLATAAAESAYDAALASYPKDADAQLLLDRARRSTGVAVTAAGDQADSQVRQEILQLEFRMAEITQRLAAKHPQVIALKVRLDQLKAAYVVGEERRYLAAQQRERILAEELRQQEQAAAVLAERVAEYQKLDNDIRQLERHSDLLSARIKEIKIDEDAGALNINVLEQGTPADRPSKPDAVRVLALALVCGLFGGAGTSYLREWISPRLRSPDDVQSRLGLQVLGIVPRAVATAVTGSGRRRALFEPGSDGATIYRAIQSSVRLAAQGDARTVAVTSCASREGKTGVACNLAAAMARSGLRVLLIDGNVHRPAQHLQFDLDAKPGLSELLRGTATPDTYIEKTPVTDLDVLPAGAPTPDPAELFNSDRFVDVLETVAEAYDQVVIDLPAVAAGPDARIVAASCDATLLVVRSGRTDRKSSEDTYDSLVNVGATILGVIVNDAPRRQQRRPAMTGLGIAERMLDPEIPGRKLDRVGPAAASDPWFEGKDGPG